MTTTTLQDNAVEPASRSELISPSPVLLLAPSEPRAPIAILSPAKRNALVSCFNAGGLHKKDGVPIGGAAKKIWISRLRSACFWQWPTWSFPWTILP